MVACISSLATKVLIDFQDAQQRDRDLDFDRSQGSNEELDSDCSEFNQEKAPCLPIFDFEELDDEIEEIETVEEEQNEGGDANLAEDLPQAPDPIGVASVGACDNKEAPYMLILIFSGLAPGCKNGEDRIASWEDRVMAADKARRYRMELRNTWLKEVDKSHKRIVYRFVIGLRNVEAKERLSLSDEQRLYRDVVFVHAVSEEFNTNCGLQEAEKLQHALMWAAQELGAFKYLSIIRDSTYVRIKPLLNVIEDEERKLPLLSDALEDPTKSMPVGLYMGDFIPNATVPRSGPLADSDWTACDMYLPHASAHGLVLSGHVIQNLLMNAAMFEQVRGGDGPALGLWTAPIRLHRVHAHSFFDTVPPSSKCLPSFVMMGSLEIEEIEEKYKREMAGEKICFGKDYQKKDTRYYYSFSRLPSRAALPLKKI